MSEADLGPLRRTAAAVADGDPFWSAVRRRHPDVDLVLLSPTAGPPAEPAEPGAARAEVGAVAGAWDLLAPVLERADAGTLSPAARWRSHGDGHRFELQAALTGLGQDGGTALLRAVVVLLGRAGWQLAPRTRRGLPALTATDGHVELRAEAGPGATVLTVRGRALRATEVERRDAEQEVASWA